MKRTMKRIMMMLAAALMTLPLFAADGNLTVSPAVVQLRGTFGQSTTQRMTVTNGTSMPFTFDLVAQDVVAEGGKRRFVDAGEIANSIAATAVFSQRSVTVQPGESAAVDVTVTIPQGAQHRAVVAIFRGTDRIMRNNVPMLASIGMLLTFTVGGEVTIDAGALQITAQSGATNLTVAQQCTNRGNDPVVARAVAAVLDENGTLIGRTTLDSRRLLPGETATIGGEFAGDLEPGRYKVLVTFDFGGKVITSSGETEVR
jgi:hypothetical protein